MWLYLKEVIRWEQGLLNGPWLNPFRKKVKSLSHVWLFATPWTIAYQAPPSMVFSKQEYWSGLPFPSPGDLPNPGIEPGSPTLQPDTLPSEPPGKWIKSLRHPYKRKCGHAVTGAGKTTWGRSKKTWPPTSHWGRSHSQPCWHLDLGPPASRQRGNKVLLF